MDIEWKGKSKGNVLGYRIFVFLIKNLGLSSAYFLLYFVATYYCFFSKNSTKSMYYYYRKRRRYSNLKSIYSIYKSYYIFGQTIIDRVAVSSGLRKNFTYDFDGIDNIKKVINNKKGGILLSAHVGNFEMARCFFTEIDKNKTIHFLTSDDERTAIKNYLESVTSKSRIKYIYISDDLSHIFEIKAALSRNEIICMSGDRYTENSKYLIQTLLGKEARFPAGPFHLASKFKVPLLFVYVMKESNLHYHLYARKANIVQNDAIALLKLYTENLEWILYKYPLQWFNYFNFWNSHKN